MHKANGKAGREGERKMKCPKCNKHMWKVQYGFLRLVDTYICMNIKCLFYGIKRLHQVYGIEIHHRPIKRKEKRK